MAQYELSGEIVLRDMASPAIDAIGGSLEVVATQADTTGDSLDRLGQTPGLNDLNERVDQLKGRLAEAARAGSKFGDSFENMSADDRIRDLSDEISRLQAKAKSGVKLTISDVNQYEKLNSELTRLQGGLDGVMGRAAGVRSAFASIGSVLGGLGIAFGAQQIVSFGVESVKLGASLQEVRDSYLALTAAAEINGQALLDSVKAASFGTISELDAMMVMNRALLSEQDALIQNLPAIVAYAASAADALGKSTLEVTQGIVDSLATGRLRSLREFGIDISQEDALAAAEALGAETDAMKRQEIVASLTAEALTVMGEKQKLLGTSSKSAADEIDAFSVAWRDFRAAMGEELVEAGAVDLLNTISNRLRGDKELAQSATDARPAIQSYIATLYELGKADEAAAASSKFQQLLRQGTGGAQGLVDLRTELEGIIYPAGQLPLILQGVSSAMSDVAGVGVGALPAYVQAIENMTGNSYEAAEASQYLRGAVMSVLGAANAAANMKDVTSIVGGGLSKVEGQLRGLVGLVDPATLSKWRAQAITDLQAIFSDAKGLSAWELSLLEEQYTDGWGNVASAVQRGQAQIERQTKDHTDRMFASSADLRGAIESALQGDMTVTDLDLQLSAEGRYQDKVNEAARQLQAIAERGFAELKVHPDWAAALKIPPDVLAGSEAELKAWAGQTSSAVNEGLRPDLINWDAFISNFQQDLENKAAKDLTIDIAVGKLKEAGLLDQDTDAIRDQIAEQLGVKVPSMSIEALFDVPDTTQQDLTAQILGGRDKFPIPAELVLAAATGSDASGNAALNSKFDLDIPGSVQLPAIGNTEDTGKTAGESVASGYAAALSAADVGAQTYSLLTTSFAAQTDSFKLAGEGLGDTIYAGFIGAMQSNMLGFADTVAGWIAPAVAAQLRSSGFGRSRGAIE